MDDFTFALHELDVTFSQDMTNSSPFLQGSFEYPRMERIQEADSNFNQ